jgi:hypothetical protein
MVIALPTGNDQRATQIGPASYDSRRIQVKALARMIHEPPAATVDLPALAGVLAARPLNVSQRIRFAVSPPRLPAMTDISAVSQRTFMNDAGWGDAT